MDEIELIKKLKTDYPNIDSFNEASTRFKVIDEILIKYLKWPKIDIVVEEKIEGNRADYILKGKNQRPLLIIETKKT